MGCGINNGYQRGRDLPGHLAGMPFPGGFKVEKRGGIYDCPIREEEKDLPYSICNFCPCKQADI